MVYNDDNTGIGCRSGKTIVLDPNSFDGQGFNSNVSVPLEDLSISVQLETTKRARTVIMNDTVASSKAVKVTFIEGSDVGGQKVLTTKYTDLTTVFEGDEDGNQTDGESLGITAIDIDFNSAYAPLITIHFTDLRGSAIFQNENLLKNGNKYTTLFELPYPIFRLTIKGYYGLPVSYDLHMVKFNAKFNSKTGNFEIIANFVGYTYAMLSDMLIGYLRAIAHTERGKAIYNKINSERQNTFGNNNVLTLDEFLLGVSKVDENIRKLPSDNLEVTNYIVYTKQLDLIDEFRNNILQLGRDLDVISDADFYRFIRFKSDLNEKEKSNSIDSYNQFQNSVIDDYNTGLESVTEFKINKGDLDFSKALTYRDLTYELVTNDDNLGELRQKLNEASVNDEKIDSVIRDLRSYVSQYSLTGTFTLYDLFPISDTLIAKTNALTKSINDSKKSVGEAIRARIKASLSGLDPSIRSTVEIFTTAVEVLMEVLFDVSVDSQKNDLRKQALSSKFKNAISTYLDYKPLDSTSVPQNSVSGALDANYYPWPEYRERDEQNGMVEAYLGNAGVLTNPEDVDELKFINDLFRAFIISAKQLDNIAIEEAKNKVQWAPANPLDTELFGQDTFPYNRIDNTKVDQIISMILTRAVSYLYLSNKKISQTQIEDFAKLEAATVLLDSPEKIKRVLNQITPENFYSAETLVNDVSVKIINKNSDGNYDYGMIFNGNDKKLIPFNNTSKNFEFNIDANDTISAFNEGINFVTNYVTSSPYKNVSYDDYTFDADAETIALQTKISKPDDGGVYLKIIDLDTYNQNSKTLIGQVERNPDDAVKIVYNEIIKDTAEFLNTDHSLIGYDPFGGRYGIQEYMTIDLPNDLNNVDYSLLFYPMMANYSDGNLGSLTVIRESENKDLLFYDLDNTSNLTHAFTTRSSAISFRLYGDVNNLKAFTRPQIPDNRKLLNDFKQNKNTTTIPHLGFLTGTNYYVGLFGSMFYYAQQSERAKSLLFLHTLPFNGMQNDFMTTQGISNRRGLLVANEVINTFMGKAGFIKAPYAWAAFLGGLLWRADSEIDPIIFNNGSTSYIPMNDGVYPTKYEYLRLTKSDTSMQFVNTINESQKYQRLDAMILQLPEQVKEEFKAVFESFVENEWLTIKPQLEVMSFDSTVTDWVNKWDSIAFNTVVVENNLIFNDVYKSTINSDIITNTYDSLYGNKKAIDNYKIFTRYQGTDAFEDGYDLKYNYFTEFKDNSDATFSILKLLSKDIVIVNNSVKIWENDLLQGLNGVVANTTEARKNVTVLGSALELYINKIVESLKGEYSTEIEETKRITQEVFGTDNTNIIKFQLYRTCKNLYDKWIGGTENADSLIFKNLRFGEDNSPLKGSNNGRNGLDSLIAQKRLGVGSEPRLIDSFRFVTRAFKDIGDDLLINPKEAAEVVKNGVNNSFYDVVTSILSSNKFNFIALPNYINYSNPKELSAMFRPMSTAESLTLGAGGPSFVCVYAGQASKNLDFKNSEYQNDGFDAQCYDGDLSPSVPDDFKRESNVDNEHENNVAIFSVNYSQQNQNIFKDITLDQSEFSETAESLKITDEIASKGAENRVTLGGQNLYNVYSVRSYKAEVEMMGNAMIQPMMYFQLNNIPMFHGAYMITQVKHSIKPNHMSTIFNGVRIRNVETPLLDAATLYMPLLDSIVNSEDLKVDLVATNTTNPNNTIPNEMLVTPSDGVINLFDDPFENSGNVLVSSIPGVRNLDGTIKTHKGVDFAITSGTNLKSIYTGKIEWLKYDAKGYGLYAVVNHGTIDGKTYKSVYGHMSELDKNVFGKNLSDLSQNDINEILNGYNPNITVSKGTIIGKSGGAPKKSYLDFFNKKYDTAGHSTGAHLHYELRIGEANQTSTSFTNLQPVFSIPYLPLNAYCTYKNKVVPPANEKIIYGDSADYWALIAICTLEAGVPQARADVAQSIYNRLATPGQPYGKTIKEIVVANKQYQPTFANRVDWVAINDSSTAIKAVMYSKNWTIEKTKTELQNTINALNNTTNQELARNFVQTRTEFLADNPTSVDAIGVVQREPIVQNNSFFWRYAGKKLIDKTPPLPPDWTSYNIERNIT